VPPLEILASGDAASRKAVGARLATQRFAGVALVVSAGGREALCLTLGPGEAYCFSLQFALQSDAVDDVAEVRHWFTDDRNLCVTPEAKELVSALLRCGMDARCGFAEPAIAQWLLDPDDKRQATIAELAASLGIRLAPPGTPRGPVLCGAGLPSLEPALRSRLIRCWPEAYLALPLTAVLVHRLKAQFLIDSFWRIEMPIAAVLAWMEHFGIACDPRDPNHVYSGILYKLAALEERVRCLVGRRVLLSSSEDVGRALFEDLELHPPKSVQFRRKANGRFAYRSSIELLKRLPPHPVIDHVLEHRRIAHAMRRIEALSKGGQQPRLEPQCAHCVQAGTGSTFPYGADTVDRTGSLSRLRSEFVQTGTATGRLATATGSFPLLSLENPFTVHEVWRPSLHEELAGGSMPEVGARVFAEAASEAPPQQRRVREGVLESLEIATCADVFPGGSETLAAYWVGHGWTAYADEARARVVRQALVRHGDSVLSYPADRVSRLAAPVKVADDTPLLHVNPRSLLVADIGRVLLSVDYSQLEVRLMAHFSRDERFSEILHSEGDVFRRIAAGWLRKAEEAVTAEERSGAKRICYGLIYGIGASRLANELGLSRQQAEEFQASFMHEYAGVAAWVQSCREQARQCGCVMTLQGRRRFLPGLAARSAGDRSHAERQAVNTACQASAADLVKIAMISIHERLRLMRVHNDGQCRMAARMLLQMHDELIFEVDKASLDEVRELVVTEMIAAGKELRVPLQVKWRTGRSWGHLE